MTYVPYFIAVSLEDLVIWLQLLQYKCIQILTLSFKDFIRSILFDFGKEEVFVLLLLLSSSGMQGTDSQVKVKVQMKLQLATSKHDWP